MSDQEEIVKVKFDEVWKRDRRGYVELVNKMEDETYNIQEPEHDNATINMVNRAVMANRYLLEHCRKGGSVLDVASGNGFESCYLAGRGYKVSGFDVAESGIEFSKELARDLGVSVDFVLGDHRVMESYDDCSFDAICALGFTRYLQQDVLDYFYSQAARILKPGGALCVSNDNRLFDIFSLNDETLKFWAETIEGYSEAAKLLPKPVLTVLRESLSVPERVFSKRSVSKHIKRHTENPLTYQQVVQPFGFAVDGIVYPDAHLMPPFLQRQVDQDRLEELRNKVCLNRAANDWRSMFFGFEFLAYLKKR